jgi:hypothetical protein
MRGQRTSAVCACALHSVRSSTTCYYYYYSTEYAYYYGKDKAILDLLSWAWNRLGDDGRKRKMVLCCAARISRPPTLHLRKRLVFPWILIRQPVTLRQGAPSLLTYSTVSEHGSGPLCVRVSATRKGSGRVTTRTQFSVWIPVSVTTHSSAFGGSRRLRRFCSLGGCHTQLFSRLKIFLTPTSMPISSSSPSFSSSYHPILPLLSAIASRFSANLVAGNILGLQRWHFAVCSLRAHTRPHTPHEETKDCRRSWKVVHWNLAWSTQSLLADPPKPFSIAIEHFRTVDLVGPVDLLLLPSLLQHPTFFRLFRRRLHLDFRSSFRLKLYV